MTEQSEGERTHNFLVTEVEQSRKPGAEGLEIVIVDARGGRVRLHLTPAVATRLH